MGWGCRFRLIGQRALDFEVNEIDRQGDLLDSLGHVDQVAKYCHECYVKMLDPNDLSFAEFSIDEVNFGDFPLKAELPEEEELCTDPQWLRSTFNILVPFR